MVPSEDLPDRAWIDSESLRKSVVIERRAGFVKALDLGYVLARKFRPCAPSQILRMGHWLKVVWADARRITTQMVKRQSVRDWSAALFVAETVGEDGTIIPPDASVAEMILRTLPDVARRYVTAVPFFPEIVRPLHARSDATRVSSDESPVLALDHSPVGVVLGDECGRLPAATFAKFFSHVGLLNRLAVGGGGIGRCPHFTLSGGS